MGTTGTTSVVFTGIAPLVGGAFNIDLGPDSLGAVTLEPSALRGAGITTTGGGIGAPIGDVMPDGVLSGLESTIPSSQSYHVVEGLLGP